MDLGPYIAGKNFEIVYKGNKVFKPISDVRKVKSSSLNKRHIALFKNSQKWASIIRIWDSVFKATNQFMKKKKAFLFDLPITTRMISSPGALTGTISSDVDPFKIKFFDKETFLTQSSQLYLEFAITNPYINSVYCWEKSFRREYADFRHLPEFTHIEFESNISFEKNLKIQREFTVFLVSYLLRNNLNDLEFFLRRRDILDLEEFSRLKTFEIVTFHEAFKLLKKKTGLKKYDKASIKFFGSYEEILLTEIIKKPLFVTHYIEEEVAFYHAKHSNDSSLVINADFLFPGYGECIGSGERVHTQKETKKKAKHFKLNYKDYKPYIESRNSRITKLHSGWGMGIERFIQVVLKLPFIWEAKVFPRIHNQNYP